MISDISFRPDGSMVVAIRNLALDATLDELPPRLGDLLPAEPAGDVWRVVLVPERFDDTLAGIDEAFTGGLALVPGLDLVVAAGHSGAFNGGARLLQGLTGSRPDLDSALARIVVQRQTRIDLGVETAHGELTSARRRAGNVAVMIVLTDGRANPLGPEVAVERAAAAKADAITIFTIGLGEELDIDALREMASQPRFFYLAPDAEDLKQIYAAIAVEIPCPAEQVWGGRP